MQELPNLPGKTHGIKHINPIIVQCDDCHNLHTHRVMTIALRAVSFNSRHHEKKLRLCHGCWAERGYYNGTYDSVINGTPEQAWAALESGHSNWESTRISHHQARQLMTQESA